MTPVLSDGGVLCSKINVFQNLHFDTKNCKLHFDLPLGGLGSSDNHSFCIHVEASSLRITTIPGVNVVIQLTVDVAGKCCYLQLQMARGTAPETKAEPPQGVAGEELQQKLDK